MTLPYRQPGLVLSRGAAVPRDVVRALQHDLRRLGYLRGGLDGVFGDGTERAVRAFQLDLLTNDGSGSDGHAPVALRSYNRGRIAAPTGVVDEGVAACLEDMLGDDRIPTLPQSQDPVADNARALATVSALDHPRVPVAFLIAVLAQESDLHHFRIPTASDPDNFIVVGLDRNDANNADRITSRGYGVGQFTLFHHPPTADEVQSLMLDPARNVQRAVRELGEKFDDFVVGHTPNTRADDRIALDIGDGPLRPCKYRTSDPLFQRDCRQCALTAPRRRIGPDTPLYPGASETLQPTKYHPEKQYDDAPDWTKFECDWPYAVRRYNGSGMNSYHYQAQVLRRLLADTRVTALLDAQGRV
jgi:peptidoglycan hydrolase-like protein with peptidoglycan-binding domain